MGSKTEEALLISRCLVFDDRRAFARLVEKYQTSVRRLFLGLTLGDEAWSDDLAQETFVKVYYRLQTFRGAAAFSTWLYRIAYNCYYDAVRGDSPRLDSLDKALPLEAPEETPLEIKHDLYQALSRLSPTERMAIELFYWEELPVAKIAAILALPEGSVKSHLFRARQQMKTYLIQNGYDA